MTSTSTRVARVTVSKIPTKLSVRLRVAPGRVSNGSALGGDVLPSVLLLLLLVVVLVVVSVPMVALHL